MNELTIIRQNGGAYIDSREVAEYIGKDHNHLLRDIRGYIAIIERNFNASKVGRIDFFLDSTYVDNRGREKPCYLLTKMACELVANKLIGEKGVLFTIAYVKRFNELERAEFERQAATPRLKCSTPPSATCWAVSPTRARRPRA
jgi:Rha family phage regulatory protein